MKYNESKMNTNEAANKKTETTTARISEQNKHVLSDYKKFSMMSKLKEQKNCSERFIDL